MQEPQQRIIDCFLRPYSGAYALARHAFGHWNSQFRRFRRWAKAGVFERLFNVISEDPDLEYALIDGTIVQVHQKASGAKGGLNIRPSGARAAG